MKLKNIIVKRARNITDFQNIFPIDNFFDKSLKIALISIASYERHIL